MEWYKQLLVEGFPEDTHSALLTRINPRNVIGTVIVLNGFRRYFNIYHPKHGEVRRTAVAPRSSDSESTQSSSASDEDLEGRGTLRNRRGASAATSPATSTSTLAVDAEGRSSKASSPTPSLLADVLLVEELLVGLPKWLDRLFDGSKVITRYYVGEWPPIR